MADLIINDIHDNTMTTGTSLRPVGMHFTPASTITVDALSLWTVASGHQVKVNIYARSGAVLTTKMGGDSIATATVAGGEVRFDLTAPATLLAGVPYAIGYCANTSAAIFGANSAMTGTRYNAPALTSISDPMPEPFGSTSNTGSVRFPYLILHSTITTISSIDQCIAGQTSEINYSEDFAAISGSITDTTITKTFVLSASDTDASTGIMPQWIDGQTCVKIGNVTITATDGVLTTADFADTYSMKYFHPDDVTVIPFTAIDLSSVSGGALAVTPTFQNSTQVLYDAVRCTVGLDGVVEFDTYTGSTYLWYRNPDDQIARLVIIDTVDGEIIAVTPAASSYIGFGVGIGF